VFTAPVRLGGRGLGSLALLGPLPAETTLRALANLVAITLEKARAIEDASHAEAAHQSEVLKSALLDSLAHDIKTPLTSIKAAATSLLGGAPGAERELLTIIDEEADRLNRLSAEVIAMARVDAGKLHLEKRSVAAGDLIGGALSELAVELRGREVAVYAAVDLPPVEADPELIQQVVKHCIENAIKYSPERSPIAVSATLKNEKIVIGIADRGPGIEDGERLRIFDRFYRGRRHRFETKGTGMGLAIAKGIVEAHGERIWVDSERGQGSTFYFSLPLSGARP
jgi:two-component system sensor histidine kinase KdpD